MIPEEFTPLLDAVLEGRADEAQFDRFQALLRSAPELIHAYTDQAHLHALLDWRAGRVRPDARSAPRRSAWIGRAAAALLLAGLGALFGAREGRREVATVLECSDESLPAGSRVGLGLLTVGDATLRLAFDRGVWLTIEGPAEMEVLSAKEMRVFRGRATARVEPLGRGFVMWSTQARVVDLGTEFGIDVEPLGATGVAVFEGEVDVEHNGEPVRLLKGEGRMIQGGKAERLVSIERDAALGVWTPRPQPAGVIASVSDNLRGSACFYQVVAGGLHEDVPAYVDRIHEWNGVGDLGIPEELLGADYVMTFMDDKRAEWLEMTVTLNRAAELFVLWDDRCPPAPWLLDAFEDTRLDIGLDEGASNPKRASTVTERGPGRSIDTRFSVWRRRSTEAGEVSLGSMGRKAAGFAMYGVAAKPLE
jgi:hypothetical protein